MLRKDITDAEIEACGFDPAAYRRSGAIEYSVAELARRLRRYADEADDEGMHVKANVLRDAAHKLVGAQNA